MSDQPRSVQGALLLSLLSKFAMSFSDGTRRRWFEQHGCMCCFASPTPHLCVCVRVCVPHQQLTVVARRA